mmetsp:Transcript_4681/g.16466  ORF Transcript_4681/g.16466 Transcript_4681/m.16466 type:complete len:882 (+) Transcript_4681:111-2756(+)
MPIAQTEGSTMDSNGSPPLPKPKRPAQRYRSESGAGARVGGSPRPGGRGSPRPGGRRPGAAALPAPMKRERFLVNDSLDDLSTLSGRHSHPGREVDEIGAAAPAPAPAADPRQKLSRQMSASNPGAAARSMLATFSPRAKGKGKGERKEDRSLQSPRRKSDASVQNMAASPRGSSKGKLRYTSSERIHKDRSPREGRGKKGGGEDVDAFKSESEAVEQRRLLMNRYKDLKKKEDKRNQLHSADKKLKDILAPDQMQMMVNAVPNYNLTVLESDMFLATVAGPNFDESARVYKETVCARSISTYPHLDGLGRAGDPICDFYYVRLFEDAIIFSLADGCNWGEAPKQAAKRAGTSLVRYLQDRLHLLKNTQRAGKFILRAVSASHAAIIDGYDDIWRVGTATLLGGVLVPLAPGQEAEIQDSDTDLSSSDSLPSSPDTGKGTDRSRDLRLGTFPELSAPDKLQPTGPGFDVAPALPPEPEEKKKEKSEAKRGEEAAAASPKEEAGEGEGVPPPLPPDVDQRKILERLESNSSGQEEKVVVQRMASQEDRTEEKTEEKTEKTEEKTEKTEEKVETEEERKRRHKAKRRKKKKRAKAKARREREAAEKGNAEVEWAPRPHKSDPTSEKKRRRHSRKQQATVAAGQAKAAAAGCDAAGAESKVPPIGLPRRKWAFVFANVGDCKAFVYSPSTRTARDITKQNRAASSSARDCGGRLGPYKEETGEPDLRNLDLRCELIDEGDIIIAVSDGVHDNLDPSMLGWTPSELHLPGSTWDEIAPEAAEAAKSKFREQRLANLVHTAGTPDACTGHVPLVDMCNALVEYCMATTEKSRQFMQKHPALELPEDYTLYPGKMDHTTCVCVKVGSASSELIRDAQEKRERLQSVR